MISSWLRPVVLGLALARFGAAQEPSQQPSPIVDAKPIQGPESTRLRALLVLDTDAPVGGDTWGRDGANMKALLDAEFQKQNLADRASIDVFAGKRVTPEGILAYYKSLKIEPTDALLFYYSGHGGHHIKKGHFLALTRGPLFRDELLAAMDECRPRLRVVLTDCCATTPAAPLPANRRGPPPRRLRPALGGMPPAREEEPMPFRVVDRAPDPRRGVPPRAKMEEPAGQVSPIQVQTPRNLVPARLEEPPMTTGPVSPLSTSLPVLSTHEGRIPMKQILDDSDGETLRHLLFRHAGLVDINACAKGELSYGHITWGGSLFTNNLIALQKSKVRLFDINRNALVEWSEFFPQLQRTTNDAGSQVPGQALQQIPEASRLGMPILP